MIKTKKYLILENKILKQKIKELENKISIYDSSENYKNKIVMEKILKFINIRNPNENYDDSIKYIPLSDFQIWICRKIKWYFN